MNIKSLPVLLIAALLAVGCGTMKVTTESTPGYAFGAIKTYQWIDGPAEILNEHDTYINNDIQKAIGAELQRRGLKEVADAAAADVQVSYYMKLKEQQEYSDTARPDDPGFSGGFTYSRKTGSWNYAEREPDINIYTVEIGTLTVLLFDAKTGERVWRGDLKTKIDRSQPPEQQQERIATAAMKLMDRSPLTSK